MILRIESLLVGFQTSKAHSLFPPKGYLRYLQGVPGGGFSSLYFWNIPFEILFY
jgi:hypothetical protein